MTTATIAGGGKPVRGLDWNTLLTEVAKAAIPLALGIGFGRISKWWKTWAGMESAVTGIGMQIGTVADQMRRLETNVTTQIQATERRIGEQVQGAIGRLDKVEQSVHRLRGRTHRTMVRQQVQITRFEERLRALVVLVRPDQAKKLHEEWDRQDTETSTLRDLEEVEEGEEEDTQ